MFIKENDWVALVSPAGYLEDKTVADKAKSLLKKWHLQSYTAPHALLQYGHFAGTDEQRKSDFQDALNRPEVKMIWALRGGYGSIRIVEDLDFSVLKKKTKLIVGFSDITIFHIRLHQLGYESVHAFMPVQLNKKIGKKIIKQTKNALKGLSINYSFTSTSYNSHFKQVEGVVIGGNLANLYSVLGTSLDFDTDEKILFIEDVGEQLYQIDRMMISLKKAKKLRNLKALLVGQFTDIPPNQPKFSKSYQEIIKEHANGNYPVIFNAPIGHTHQNFPLILGRKLVLTNNGHKINIYQPGINTVQNEKK